MKQFVLNEDNLRKGWSGASEFWFSRQDMQVHSMAELADLDHPEDTGTSAYLLSLGYIPAPTRHSNTAPTNQGQ